MHTARGCTAFGLAERVCQTTARILDCRGGRRDGIMGIKFKENGEKGCILST
jgi:hypothetical protein